MGTGDSGGSRPSRTELEYKCLKDQRVKAENRRKENDKKRDERLEWRNATKREREEPKEGVREVGRSEKKARVVDDFRSSSLEKTPQSPEEKARNELAKFKGDLERAKGSNDYRLYLLSLESRVAAEKELGKILYDDFKDKYTREGVDENELIEKLEKNHPQEDHSLMLKEHLKEIYDDKDVNLALKRAFAVIRGKDWGDRIQKIQPLSDSEIAMIAADYNKRYETDSRDVDDDVPTAKKVYTNVKGHNPSYTNVMDLKEGSLRFQENFQRGPDKTDPSTLTLEGNVPDAQVYDNRVEPFEDDQKIEGTKPLHHSKIMGMQIDYLAKETGFNLSDFNPSVFEGEQTVNREAVRTMRLYMGEGEMATFAKGTNGYFAVLGLGTCKGKWLLLAERFPMFEVTEVAMHMGDDEDGIYITTYNIGRKQESVSSMSGQAQVEVQTESSESGARETNE